MTAAALDQAWEASPEGVTARVAYAAARVARNAAYDAARAAYDAARDKWIAEHREDA